MSIFAVENLYKTYGEKTLFDHISFTIAPNQRIGLIGINGTGKSTLLKVMAGIEGAEEGECIRSNQLTLEYLSQQPELDEQLTVLEQIYYGPTQKLTAMRQYENALHEIENEPDNELKQKQLLQAQQKMDECEAWDAIAEAKTILTKLGITNFTGAIAHMSGGQKKRIALAKALIQPADVLLLDEPTNHLDNHTIEWLESHLAQYRGALVLVTHDRYFLNRVTNHIFELDKGQLYPYVGNYEAFLEKKAERELIAEQKESKRQSLLKRELAWMRKGAKARTTKQKARIQRFEALQDEKEVVNTETLDFAIGSVRLGKKVIEINDVSKHFEQKCVISQLHYLITRGERLGIIGPNGSGKTTLLNILAGRVQPDSGTVDIGETVKIGYYTQDDQEINEDLRVIEYIKEVAEVVYTPTGDVITAEQMLERFLFSRAAQWTYIRRLSGGERRRLYLLKVLMGEPNVLFLDEPTNDLDTETLTVLEDYLDQFPGVVLTVSHDRYFLDKVVDHLLVFKGEGEVIRFQGSYSDYREIEKMEEEEKLMARQIEKEKVQKEQPKTKRKKLSYKDQQEWNTIEEKIEKLEEKKEQLEQLIIEAGSDYGKIQDMMKEQKEVEEELEKTIERWTELSLLLEEIEEGKN
ncbi:ABC-F family ATP-binding cassette domain-containing protein [Alkalihalobacillus sp. LMS39]|uniref:ABC-F family ATP-binding cassette domain-containing protein n=1 Tax=Alkalihalobacillus sp. LMS39 TaxID=2924032 RepID=UPI001FB2BA16|nr:ABC-F family ATP-binding cassette domain-containing protein [Alkalihalobacillus sp. LMS39]UOE95605.1 ATP-binding cassette domain-containing protein [Alkalihalobacillus sp. LMS39]